MQDHEAEAREWDEFYSGGGEGAPVWSGLPNGALVAEVVDLVPGSALDVGCGEGGDAIWLAQRGWQVTAIDPSQLALDRAAAAARRAEVEVGWICGGLPGVPAGTETYDLVLAQYPVIRLSEAAIATLLAAVAPGGTLLFVHHDLDAPGPGARASGAGHGDRTCHRARGVHVGSAGRGFDPAEFVMPNDVATALDHRWVVEVHDTRPRPGPLPPEAGHVNDIVLRARRVATD
jgi:SAM-dependent methyltransferase